MLRTIVPLFLVGLLGGACWGADEPARSAEKGLLPRISVGIGVSDLPNEGEHGGVRIQQVRKDSAAAKADLKAGDIIVRVSGRQVDDFDQLVSTLSGHRPGDQVTFVVLREGKPKEVKVTLGKPSEDGKKPELARGSRLCPFLGVGTVPVMALTEDSQNTLGLTSDQGVVVMEVIPESPAARVGLRHGDRIISVDGKEIEHPDQLRHYIHQAKVGQEITLKIQRGEQTQELRPHLIEGPCDVHLFMGQKGPDNVYGKQPTIEELQRQLQAMERRLKQLESRKEPRKP